jgi:hypothetical protein
LWLGTLAAILFAAYRLIQTLSGERIDEMKSARRARRLSTGHDRARPDIYQSSQIELIEFDAN